MLTKDLVSLNPVPAVITLSALAQLREDLEAEGDSPSPESHAALENLAQGYYLADSHRTAFESILQSLVRPKGPGGAFLIRGIYGSGKTHLLSVIGLLAEYPLAWRYFLNTNPDYRSSARCFAPGRRLLVVPITLDEYRATNTDLEDIIFDQIQGELARSKYDIFTPLSDQAYFLDLVDRFVVPQLGEQLSRFLEQAGEPTEWDALQAKDPKRAAELAHRFLRQEQFPLDLRQSRAQRLGRLREIMEEHGLAGVVLLIDELSLYLGAKSKPGLDRDASFLQFLAQQSQSSPIWMIAALQRGLEDLGDIDTHTLRQIKDRFHAPLTLSLAHLRTVLDKKLIRKADSSQYLRTMDELYQDYAGQGGPLSFSREELAQVYPLNPLTLQLLESLAATLFSQTRSLIQFVQGILATDGSGTDLLERHWDLLITPDLAFDHFQSQLASLPEARKHWEAYQFYQKNWKQIAPGNDQLAQRLLKILVLTSLANLRWSARQLADTLIGCSEREVWRNYAAVRECLEMLRRRGAYLEIIRQPGEFQDLYFLDVSSELSEIIRRRLNEIAASFSPDDGRILDQAFAACSREPFPLASVRSAQTLSVDWLNSQRFISVELRSLGRLQASDLENLAGSLASPQSRQDCHLFIAFGVEEQAQRWKELAPGISARFASGLAAWVPRLPTQAELELLRDHAARHLLLSDTSLQASGEEMRQRLAEDQGSLDLQTSELMRALYLGGRVIDRQGQTILDADQLSALENWPALMGAVASHLLNCLFPKFPPISPRRVVAKGATAQIINEFIKPGSALPAPGSPLERHLVNIMEPLGLSARSQGKFVLRTTLSPLLEQLLGLVPEAQEAAITPEQVRAYGELQQEMAKSEFGLTAQQFELVAACLIKSGHLVGLDAFLQPIPARQLESPLSQYVRFFARTQPIAAEYREEARELARVWLRLDLPQLDLPAQENLWSQVLESKQVLESQLPQLKEKLSQMISQLGQHASQWAKSQQAIDRMGELAAQINPALPSNQGLTTLIDVVRSSVARGGGWAMVGRFRQVQKFLMDDGALVMDTRRYLTDPRLRLPPDSMLAKQRTRLLKAMGRGEDLLDQMDRFQRWAADFSQGYQKAYLAWHRQAYSPARFQPLRDLRESENYRALAIFSQLALDVPHDLATTDAAIGRELSKYCPGSQLPAAMDKAPICPTCSLALRVNPELQDHGELTKLIELGNRELFSALLSPERVALFQRRLAVEGEPEVSGNIAQILRLSSDASPKDILALFSEKAIAWLNQGLRSRAVAERSLEKLAQLLRGKRLTKRQIIDLVSQWLEAEGLSDDDLLSIE